MNSLIKMHDPAKRSHWFHPRSSREAFGCEFEPLRDSFSFLGDHTPHAHHYAGWVIIAVVLLALVAAALVI